MVSSEFNEGVLPALLVSSSLDIVPWASGEASGMRQSSRAVKPSSASSGGARSGGGGGG